MMRLLAFALLAATASAFVEDLCAVPFGTLIPGTNKPVPAAHFNLFQTAYTSCDVTSPSAKCLEDVTYMPFARPACCMSSVHMLSTYALAQAVGLKSELAYFLALYSSAPNGDYAMCDVCGKSLAAGLQAPAMTGLQALEIPAGGFFAHQPATWNRATHNGLDVDVKDHETEGFIASVRDWMYSGEEDFGYLPHHQRHHDGCVGGYTVIHGRTHNPYSGPACKLEGYMNAEIPINASAPNVITAEQFAQMVADKADPKVFYQGVKKITGARSYFGPQLVDKTAGYTLNNLPLWLAANPAKSINPVTGAQIPDQIIKLGLYFHFLADRISNYECVDAEGTKMNKIARDPIAYDVFYDADKCSASSLAFNHFKEVGQTVLSDTTMATIGKLWNEISTWASEMTIRHPDWFNAALIPSPSKMRNFQRSLLAALTPQSAHERLQTFLNLYKNYGWPTLYGYPNYCAWCDPAKCN